MANKNRDQYPEIIVGKLENVPLFVNFVNGSKAKPPVFRNYFNEFFETQKEFERDIYSFFCCFDEGNMVVLFNGFQKKTQKTIRNEIDKAIKIKNEYFTLKSKINETGK